METQITIKLSSGKKIELTQEEHDELKSGLGETIGVPYPVYPAEWTPYYGPKPWQPVDIWYSGDTAIQ